MSPFDLHVLGTPPAFILSQDQTLMLLSPSFRALARYCFLDATAVAVVLLEFLSWIFQGYSIVQLSLCILLYRLSFSRSA